MQGDVQSHLRGGKGHGASEWHDGKEDLFGIKKLTDMTDVKT